MSFNLGKTLLGIATGGIYTYFDDANRKKQHAEADAKSAAAAAVPPPLPSATTPQVLESEAAIRKRLSQSGRGTTIFTGGLFDNPSSRKERLIPV